VELAGRLEPELQDALDHPLRREILRSLNGSERGSTPAELASRLRPLSLSQVNYHVQVLVGEGAVVAVGDSPFGGRSYISDLSREAEVVEVLQATQRRDRARLCAMCAGDVRSRSAGSDR
jgi:DNA-binding transcriptional ArsR family regulator